MKNVAKILTGSGISIMFLGGMCDADGAYYTFLLLAIAAGALLGLSGAYLMELDRKRQEKRRSYFYMRRRDRRDSDLEIIEEFEDKKIAP